MTVYMVIFVLYLFAILTSFIGELSQRMYNIYTHAGSLNVLAYNMSCGSDISIKLFHILHAKAYRVPLPFVEKIGVKIKLNLYCAIFVYHMKSIDFNVDIVKINVNKGFRKLNNKLVHILNLIRCTKIGVE